MTRWRCLIGSHEWTTFLDTTNPVHVECGYTWRLCDHCAAAQFAPGVFSTGLDDA